MKPKERKLKKEPQSFAFICDLQAHMQNYIHMTSDGDDQLKRMHFISVLRRNFPFIHFDKEEDFELATTVKQNHIFQLYYTL